MGDADFAGKVAFVTGGARGIGATLVDSLRQKGATVVIADRDAADPVDVSDPDQVLAAMEHLIVMHGRLDMVFSNAGVLIAGPTEKFPVAAFDRIVAVNLRGAFLTARAAIPHLRRSGGPMVFTASTSALIGAPFEAAYAASKAGIVGLARSLAAELASDGIRVNVVAPGWVDTPFNDPIWAAQDNDAAKAAIVTTVPMKRQSTPAEIVPAMLFLASTAASYMTGHVLTVDGGLTSLR